jgi:hypothetical protein
VFHCVINSSIAGFGGGGAIGIAIGGNRAVSFVEGSTRRGGQQSPLAAVETVRITLGGDNPTPCNVPLFFNLALPPPSTAPPRTYCVELVVDQDCSDCGEKEVLCICFKFVSIDP